MPLEDSTARRPWRRWAFLVLGVQLGLLAVCFVRGPLHVDEAWIGEPAYFLAEEGAPRSELFPGQGRADERLVLYHYFFVYAGAGAIKLLGWGLESLRSVSLIAALLLAVLFFRHLRRLYSPTWAAAGVVLLFSLPLQFKFAYTYRPEVAVALWGFLSFTLLSPDPRSTRWLGAAGAGLAAGLAAGTHANGFIFALAGAAVLMGFRRWPLVPVFLACTAAPLIPYALDLAGHWELFREQLQSPLAGDKISQGLNVLGNLTQEHKRLFRNPETILPSTALIASVAALTAKGARRWQWGYLAALLLGLGLLQGKTAKYMVIVLPLIVNELVAALHAVAARPRPGKLGTALHALTALLFAYGLTHQVSAAMTGRPNLAAVNHRLASFTESGAAILAPTTFVFDELPHHRVVSLLGAEPEGFAHTGPGLAGFAVRHGAFYLVLDSEWLDRVGDLQASWLLVAEENGSRLYRLKQARASLETRRAPWL